MKLSKRIILDALLLALTAGIIIVKAVSEMDGTPLISGRTE